jgi:hypothetical protein
MLPDAAIAGQRAAGPWLSALSRQLSARTRVKRQFLAIPSGEGILLLLRTGGPLLKSRKSRPLGARRTSRGADVSRELRRLSGEFADATFATFGKEIFAAKVQKSAAQPLRRRRLPRGAMFWSNCQRTDAKVWLERPTYGSSSNLF